MTHVVLLLSSLSTTYPVSAKPPSWIGGCQQTSTESAVTSEISSGPSGDEGGPVEK